MNEFRHTILCVDDEKNILQSIKRLLRKEKYGMLFANSGAEALEILEANKVQLVISDQRMPGMNGTELMAAVKERYPDLLRIILTGYTDVDSITESINQGHIYKFFLKPWNDQNLKLEIRQALEQYDLIKANQRLDETVVKQNQELQRINDHLEELVEQRTMEIALKNQALELSHAILDDLPISVMGIDEAGVIVLANKMAQQMVADKGLNIGGHLEQYFSSSLMGNVSDVLSKGVQVDIKVQTLEQRNYNAQIMPLGGRHLGKGIIMTLESI